MQTELPSTFKLTLKVTLELIEAGVPCDPDRCPLALAGKRETEMDFQVGVTRASIYRSDEYWKLLYSARLPWPAVEWISHYDDGDPVEPAEFELEFKHAN